MAANDKVGTKQSYPILGH